MELRGLGGGIRKIRLIMNKRILKHRALRETLHSLFSCAPLKTDLSTYSPRFHQVWRLNARTNACGAAVKVCRPRFTPLAAWLWSWQTRSGDFAPGRDTFDKVPIRGWKLRLQVECWTLGIGLLRCIKTYRKSQEHVRLEREEYFKQWRD